MLVHKSLLLFACGIFVLLAEALSSKTANFEETLSAIHSALSADIAILKGELFIKVFPEIERLKGKQCQCSVTDTEDNKSLASFIQEVETRMETFAKAFMNEKSEYRSFIKDITDFNDVIQRNKHDLSEFINKTQESMDRKNVSISKQKDEIAAVKFAIDGIEDRMRQLSNTLANISRQIEHVNPTSKTGMYHPSFVSQWFKMESQNEILCERVIEHDLNKLPVKVDVQIKSIEDSGKDWIFSGDSVFQSDDDQQQEYGGVVFLYNETHVILRVPKNSNNHASGILMTTSGHDSRFINVEGDNFRFSAGLVRVRIWLKEDFPNAAYTSDWLPLDITDSDKTFYELSHGLSDYPALVTVQIQSSDGLISEGMGAVMTSPLRWSNAGGVLYGYDDKTVRVWAAYLSSELRANKVFCSLFGHPDGWGKTSMPEISNGYLKVNVWSAESFTVNKQLFEYTGNGEKGIVSSYSHVNIDLDNDLLTFNIQALDGANRGFLFKGYGSSQARKEPFGGAIFAYTRKGEVKVWRPDPGKNGFLININQPYGSGKLNQASNSAAFRVTLLKSTY